MLSSGYPKREYRGSENTCRKCHKTKESGNQTIYQILTIYQIISSGSVRDKNFLRDTM